MVAIIDYGVGNLFSLTSSFSYIGIPAVATSDPEGIRSADHIILPGVGAFRDAIGKLNNSGMGTLVKELAASGKPIMGICLGMQLLFDKSFEYGEHDGLGLIRGNVRPIADVIPKHLKIPQIGWNALKFKGEPHPLFKYIREGSNVYFVHSYYAADCDESVIAVCEYGEYLTAAVACRNVCGCQFHPELKSRPSNPHPLFRDFVQAALANS